MYSCIVCLLAFLFIRCFVDNVVLNYFVYLFFVFVTRGRWCLFIVVNVFIVTHHLPYLANAWHLFICLCLFCLFASDLFIYTDMRILDVINLWLHSVLDVCCKYIMLDRNEFDLLQHLLFDFCLFFNCYFLFLFIFISPAVHLHSSNFESTQLNNTSLHLPRSTRSSPHQQHLVMASPMSKKSVSHHPGMSCIKSRKLRRRCLLHIDAYQPWRWEPCFIPPPALGRHAPCRCIIILIYALNQLCIQILLIACHFLSISLCAPGCGMVNK